MYTSCMYVYSLVMSVTVLRVASVAECSFTFQCTVRRYDKTRKFIILFYLAKEIGYTDIPLTKLTAIK